MSLTLTNPSAYAELQAAMLALATTPGAQRERALSSLKAIGNEPAFSIAFGRKLATISGAGQVLKTDAKGRKTGDEDYDAQADQMEVSDDDDSSKISFLNPALGEHLVEGSSGLTKMIEDMPILCGVTLIVAGTGEGKTPLAHSLAGYSNLGADYVRDYGVVRIGEPFAKYTSNDALAAASMGRAAVECTDIVVDSIKDLLGAGGALTKGGISRVALSMLSHWSAIGAALGCTFYVPLNPSTGEDEILKLMISAANSSATTTIFKDGGSWVYSARPGEGLDRITGKVPESALPSTPGKKKKMENRYNRDSARTGSTISASLSSDVLSGVVSRSTIAKV